MTRWTRLGFSLLALNLAVACAGDDASDTNDGAAEQSTEEESDGATSDETDGDRGDEAREDTGDEADGETGEASCYDGMHAIVSDIDETLTTSDGEFLMQLVDSTHDPAEREEAAELINDYHARGFTIVYLSARGENQSSADEAMVPVRNLTFDWLEDHGFPVDENTRIVLADGFVFGDSAAEYKGQALLDLQAEGFVFDYAYGNASSDIAGYEAAGIAKDVTFIIGEQAGSEGTVAIDEEGWATHRAAQIPTVADFCEP